MGFWIAGNVVRAAILQSSLFVYGVLTNVFMQSVGRASPTPCTSATSSSEAAHAQQLRLIYSLSLWVSLTDRWSRDIAVVCVLCKWTLVRLLCGVWGGTDLGWQPWTFVVG